MHPIAENPAKRLDFVGIKRRQQATSASGDFAVIDTALRIVGEPLVEAADIRAGLARQEARRSKCRRPALTILPAMKINQAIWKRHE